MTESEQALANVIDTCQPKRIVALGETGQRLAHQWSEQHECEVTPLAPEDTREGLSLPQTQDLALVTEALEQLNHKAGQTLLGQLRNYGTRQIAVLIRDQSDWSLSDFIGLGFKRQARVKNEEEERTLTLYTYNINSYNHKRTWNNPKYWANPEMWDKARW